MDSLRRKRFENFHEALKALCINGVEFDNHLVIDHGHLLAKKKDYLRLAIGKEMISSIITGGQLLLDRCEVSQSGLRKLTMVALFDEITWIDFEMGKTMASKRVAIKIVVKETPRDERHVVVTVFRDKTFENGVFAIPEVGHEIWN